ncbi:MAG TPA: DegV family protein [Anaerolineae bacterium]|nr:DegV family protein [Anaerolineae bacterium]HQH39731.1 DegV family protein [Anaerolineae bacterium]
MQIVTDSGMDLYLPPEEMPAMEVHIVRHALTLEGKTYRSGLDIQATELYQILKDTGGFPLTSQPSPGDFAAVYRQLAATDPDILAIQMSSGLSGTVNAAQAGAAMVPEANVTVVDSKTLSAAMGWQIAAAARAIKAGWAKERIIALLHRIATVSDSIYTLDELKYLIHGGRISHLKGLLASTLRIRPLIGVAKDSGMYEQLGMARTMDAAIKGLIKLMTRKHAPGTPLRTQVIHALNPESANALREEADKTFQCTWLPMGTLSPVLGAHTGPSMVGIAYAALADYPVVP